MPEDRHHDSNLAAVLMRQNEIIAAQGEMLIALHRSQPPRQVEYGDPDYQKALAKERKAFKQPTFQNGIDIGDQASGLSDETIERVGKLKAGRYIGGLIEVQVSPKGAVNFIYKNKTPDQRFALMVKFRDFADLVNQIWAEMQAASTAVA